MLLLLCFQVKMALYQDGWCKMMPQTVRVLHLFYYSTPKNFASCWDKLQTLSNGELARETPTWKEKCRNTNKQATSPTAAVSTLTPTNKKINQNQLSSIDFSYLCGETLCSWIHQGSEIFGFLFIRLYIPSKLPNISERIYTTKHFYENKFHEWHLCNGLPNIFYGFFRAIRKLFSPFLPQNFKASG